MMLKRASSITVESFFQLRLRTRRFLLDSTSSLPALHVGRAEGVSRRECISPLSTAAERSSRPDIPPEYNDSLGDFQSSQHGPRGQYASHGKFIVGTTADGFHQDPQRVIPMQNANAPMGGRGGFSEPPDSFRSAGSSMPSQYAIDGRLHQIPPISDGRFSGMNQRSREGFSGDSPVGFQQNPADYLGGPNAYRDFNHGANLVGDYPCHSQQQHLQSSNAYNSEMRAGYQQNSGGNSGIHSHTNWNFAGNSIGANKQVQHDSLNPTDYHHRTRDQVGSPGLFSGSSTDNHNGNFQQRLQGSHSSVENQGSHGRPYAGNDVGQFLLNGSRADEENVTTYNGTLDELDVLCKEGKVKDAVKVLGMLQQQGIFVDLPRYFLLFQLCGEHKCQEEAKNIHNHVLSSLGNVEVKVYNKMLDMYSKCGSVEDAQNLFETMPQRNLASWDIMIMGLATNGLGEDAVDLFTEFKQKGLKPDGGIFLTVLHVCGILGAVDEGFLHFESMSKEFGIQPTMEHYCGVVAMLGTAGHLDEAIEFIDSIPTDPTVDVWETLMNLCRVHGNAELGDLCVQKIENLDPSKLTEDARKGLLPVKASDQVTKDKKKAELGARGRVHEYRAGDRSHPESDKIYALLKGLAIHMRETGYIPELRVVLHDIDQESKEDAVLQHSEKLALSYGLMTTPARSPIRIIKNLRSCVDCHNFMKIISKLVGRQLIIRDAKRFHHFEHGLCSCRDYW